jgi:hypothetical protein
MDETRRAAKANLQQQTKQKCDFSVIGASIVVFPGQYLRIAVCAFNYVNVKTDCFA